jgi:hypothetical protein
MLSVSENTPNRMSDILPKRKITEMMDSTDKEAIYRIRIASIADSIVKRTV